jgi:hypothetical protein
MRSEQPTEYILAVDPGLATGLAWRYEGVFGSSVVPGGRFGLFDEFTHTINQTATPTEIVCEDFIITAATARKSAQPDPYRIIGWLELWAYQHGIPFFLQSPSTGKGFGTDAKLKHMGWYTTGNGGHDVDAARHLLTYLATRRDPAVLEKLRSFE